MGLGTHVRRWGCQSRILTEDIQTISAFRERENGTWNTCEKGAQCQSRILVVDI